jgi:hypothetical protein
VNFRETATVSFFAGKSRRDKGANDVERKLNANDTRAETEYVAVVVFA